MKEDCFQSIENVRTQSKKNDIKRFKRIFILFVIPVIGILAFDMLLYPNTEVSIQIIENDNSIIIGLSIIFSLIVTYLSSKFIKNNLYT